MIIVLKNHQMNGNLCLSFHFLSIFHDFGQDFIQTIQQIEVYKGSAGIIRSNTDTENEMELYGKGDQIVLEQGERHRLIGLDDYCVVATIWQHTDKNNPSDEDDIIRVQDDFGR